MKNNTILSISTVVIQVARIAIATLAGLIIVVLIGSLINDPFSLSEFTSTVSIVNPGLSHALFGLKESNFWISVFVALQNLLILIAWFQLLGYGKTIISNIKSIKTFAKDNVKAFSNISKLAIFLLLIQLVTFSSEQISFSIGFSYVFFAFAAIILTQVFKEGQKLLEENELTV